MVITPWSWSASNGIATTEQTQQAYAALVFGGDTSLFSRLVWNDLIDKTHETALALGLDWLNDYTTKTSAYINTVYGDLTAARFNSLRHNTKYRSWTWSYDTAKSGYTGRTDFRGVASYGEVNADTVYGSYILELAGRLNTVIGIINGTADEISQVEHLNLITAAASYLSVFASLPVKIGQALILSETSNIEQADFETQSLNISISHPKAYASLETEAQFEGNANAYHMLIPKTIIRTSRSTFGLILYPLVLLPFAEAATAGSNCAISYMNSSFLSDAKGGIIASEPLSWQKHIGIIPVGEANIAVAVNIPHITLSNRIVLKVTAISEKLQWFSSNIKGHHNISAQLGQSSPYGVVSNTALSQDSYSNIEKTDAFVGIYAAGAVLQGGIANLDTLEEYHGLTVKVSFDSSALAVLKTIRFAYLSAFVSFSVNILGELNTDGFWQYPAQAGAVLFVPQIYSTEKFNESMFWDFEKPDILHTGQIASSATWDMIYNKAVQVESMNKLGISASLEYLDTGRWELPIQTGGDIYLTQAMIMKASTNILEVQ